MKTFLQKIALIGLFVFFGSFLQAQALNKETCSCRFLQEDGKPSLALLQLLAITGIEGCEDLSSIVEETQKKWIAIRQGQGNLERRDLVDSPEQTQLREQILSLAEQLGIFDASMPTVSHYKYGICLVAFMPSVRDRVYALVEAWKSGIRFDMLFFLGGERPLRKCMGEADDFLALLDPSKSPLPFRKDWQMPTLEEICYETEYDMMRVVWDQVEIPEDMRIALEGKVFFVNTPKGDAPRPSTKDTYNAWLIGYAEVPGSVLSFSSPGVWLFQHLTGCNVLPKEYPLETVAPAAVKDAQKVSVVLDTIAKCLYELQKNQTSSFR